MSIQEIEKAVIGLSPSDLIAFTQWFEEYQADRWDRQIERDSLTGRLDAAVNQANDDFEARRCTPL